MTMPAAVAGPQFNPAHPNLQAFVGTSSVPTPRAIFPAWAKRAIACIIIGDVAIVVLVLITVPAASLAIILPLLFLSIFALFAIIFTIQIRTSIKGSPGDAAKQATLTRFAADNGLLYRTRSQLPAYPGCIFTDMNTRLPYVYDHFSTISGRYLDFGNYHSVSMTGDGPGGHLDPDPLQDSWGFIALQMDQQLPNILLVSKNRVGGQTVLPAQPDPSQRLSLEGNFDQYFTLYCPKDFEQDALYIFTPDLMALLMDEAAPFDVEIIDKWMFLYVPRPFNSMDPAVYQRVFRILDTVGTKIVGQTSHYSDPALAPSVTVAAGALPPVTDSTAQGLPPAAAPTGWHFTWNPALFGGTSPEGTRLRPKPQLVGMLVIVGLFVLVFVGLIVWGIVSGRAHFG